MACGRVGLEPGRRGGEREGEGGGDRPDRDQKESDPVWPGSGQGCCTQPAQGGREREPGYMALWSVEVWLGLWKSLGNFWQTFCWFEFWVPFFGGIGFLVAFSASSSLLPLVLLKAERMLNR